MTLFPRIFSVQTKGKLLGFKRVHSSPQRGLNILVANANTAWERVVIRVDDVYRVPGMADLLTKEERITPKGDAAECTDYQGAPAP